MSASAHSYRNIEAEGRPSGTHPVLKALADAALAVLARDGERTDDNDPGPLTWRFDTKTVQGMAFEIRCSGPDLPAAVPADTISPADIPKDPNWRETYRLIVAPPLIAFDICWRADGPLRIMTFSRGDWETQLTDLAVAAAGSHGRSA